MINELKIFIKVTRFAFTGLLMIVNMIKTSKVRSNL